MPRPDDNIIHVRFARTQPITADALACLDVSERAEASRLPQEAAQDYVRAHLLLRQTLSEFADIAPADWHFDRAAHGKPFTLQAPLHFNLSHARGMVAIAVSFSREVGIDVEKIEPHHADAIIAQQMFSPSEFELWQGAQERVATFFHIWTMKEAVMKASGLGMALPLHSFNVTLASPQFVHTRVDELWRVEFGMLDQCFAWALAASCPSQNDQLVIHKSQE